MAPCLFAAPYLFATPCLSAEDVATEPLSLTWDAPVDCPSQEAVLHGVERIVGRPLDEVAVPWTAARGAVMRQHEGWLLQVIVVNADDTKNERLLAAASCAEAAEAASVVLATSLGATQPTTPPADASAQDPSATPPPATNVGAASQAPIPPHAPPSALPPPSAGPPAPGPAPAPARVATVASPADALPIVEQPQPPDAEAARWSTGTLGARLGLDTSLLGGPAAVVGLVGGVEFAPATVRAFASATNSVDQAAPATEGGARLALYAGGLQGCLPVAGTTLRLEGCVGGQVGALRASGYGIAGTHVDSVFWSAGQGSGVLRWRRGGTGSLWLEAELVVPFRRLYVELADTELHRTPRASAQLWLGFSLDL